MLGLFKFRIALTLVIFCAWVTETQAQITCSPYAVNLSDAVCECIFGYEFKDEARTICGPENIATDTTDATTELATTTMVVSSVSNTVTGKTTSAATIIPESTATMSTAATMIANSTAKTDNTTSTTTAKTTSNTTDNTTSNTTAKTTSNTTKATDKSNRNNTRNNDEIYLIIGVLLMVVFLFLLLGIVHVARKQFVIQKSKDHNTIVSDNYTQCKYKQQRNLNV
ncbi:putative uncharacterized protein DDB_G0281251 [Zeugodacus cucurbitae]|uniref:putative uncharacterized protein DDB_G0281251 n=1 Tax=Zeugodacus cucurbitae TaxID=28588 RepID=UPI0023D9101B|nr:putative uncharacterized protein DDB_G0281251 [Zeugodacus cucurbitae]